jgi:trimethylamine:corrinoid methyltransferase-like protein
MVLAGSREALRRRPTLADADILPGAGNLEGQGGLSLLQLVRDDKWLASVKRMRQGLAVDALQLAVDVFRELGPRGQFLATEHPVQTLTRMGGWSARWGRIAT